MWVTFSEGVSFFLQRVTFFLQQVSFFLQRVSFFLHRCHFFAHQCIYNVNIHLYSICRLKETIRIISYIIFVWIPLPNLFVKSYRECQKDREHSFRIADVKYLGETCTLLIIHNWCYKIFFNLIYNHKHVSKTYHN